MLLAVAVAFEPRNVAAGLEYREEPMESALTKRNTKPSQKMKFLEWQREFEAALTEGDPQTLRQRVDAAEAAIFLRSQISVGRVERQAMDAATQKLRAIQKNKLGYPDWNKR
jgi:hypothetical protein